MGTLRRGSCGDLAGGGGRAAGLTCWGEWPHAATTTIRAGVKHRAPSVAPVNVPLVPASASLAREVDAFLESLDLTPPDALSACAQWRAHEVAAHLGAGALEIALALEAHGEGRPVPATRGFEEREAPFRALADPDLRARLPGLLERVGSALDAVLAVDPDAVVPWSGREMVVATFVTHLRSEFALHRFDLVGDDEIGVALLAQPELTDHAVAVLGRALVARGAASATAGFTAAIASRDTRDVVVVVDDDGARLTRADGLEPAVVGDPAARLLLLWGRQPADPRRLTAPGGAGVLAALRSLLAGY